MTVAPLAPLLQTLKPMLAEPCEVPLSTLVGTHIFDEKLDGIRAIASVDSASFRLTNRNGRDITATYPDLEASGVMLPSGLVLDGEITAIDGSFGDIARRDRQRGSTSILALAREVPAMFTAFDILHHPEHGDVRGWTYGYRRALLEDVPLTAYNWERSFTSPDPALYDRLKSLGREGVVAKRLTSTYVGGRSHNWLKFKVKHRVSAVAVGYMPGNGKRSECGAFLLAMLDGARPVSVGKVGSGFTETSLAQLRASLDSEHLPVLEIECLGKTTGGVLRQPVFLGVRTDLEIHDITIDQLDNLPKG